MSRWLGHICVHGSRIKLTGELLRSPTVRIWLTVTGMLVTAIAWWAIARKWRGALHSGILIETGSLNQ